VITFSLVLELLLVIISGKCLFKRPARFGNYLECIFKEELA